MWYRIASDTGIHVGVRRHGLSCGGGTHRSTFYSPGVQVSDVIDLAVLFPFVKRSPTINYQFVPPVVLNDDA